MTRPLAALLCVLLLSASSLSWARPLDHTQGLDRVVQIDRDGKLPGRITGTSVVFNSAQAGTTYFGGTVWDGSGASTGSIGAGGHWEALPDSCWTFDTGVGSSFTNTVARPGGSFNVPVNPFKDPTLHTIMEGWTGIDVSYGGTNPYYRRLTTGDFAGGLECVGALNGLGGNASFWCGVLNGTEADALCYAAGQGYGNSWFLSIEQTFPYVGGNVNLSFDYFSDTEPAFDYNYVVIDTSAAGDEVTVQTYTGFVGNGNDNLVLSPGVSLPSAPGNIIIRFRTSSDGAYSDEDGLYGTTCGAFAVDDIAISGGVTHNADFEAGTDGWNLSAPLAGNGGDWSDIVNLADLPPFQTPCACDLQDSVLALIDLTQGGGGGHGLFQDNLAASPWIDLNQHGLTGIPGKIVQFHGYFELSLLNYIFVQVNVQWYPRICPVTGGLVTSAMTSNGFVYFFGGVPFCTTNPANATTIDFGDVVDAGAEQMRIALGVISYCRFFGGCTGVTNSTPWYDYVKLGVFGDPDAPYLSVNTIDLPQDSFPQNGTLRIDAPGRIDCNNVKGFSSPEPGSSLGDTLIVNGGFNECAEVRTQFSVKAGPGAKPGIFESAQLNAWLTSHNPEGMANGQMWYSARMDTAEQGGTVAGGSWMGAYHELDPNFAGADTDTDPSDLDPNGIQSRLANDIFPDDLFTPGTRLNVFYKAQTIDSTGTPVTGVWFTVPDTTGGNYFEMEVMPSSTAADSTWNCVLYVDHFDGRGAQPFIETALQNTLGGGSNNFENTAWDRWDVRAPSSQQASFGRPLGSQYGATVNQSFAYKMIVWNTGNLGAFNLSNEDADVLRPWLNLTDAGLGFNNFYASGDGFAQSVTGEAASEPNALQLLNVDMRVSFTCGTVRDPGCGSANVKNEPCMDIDPVGGAVAGDDGTHYFGGNFCPQLRSFDVITPALGSAAAGDEEYNSSDGVIQYTSVSHQISGGPDFKTMLDGGSIHYREAMACDGVGDQAQIDDRMDRVLTWMGYGAAAVCEEPLAILDPGDGGGDGFVTALAAGRPNPFNGRGVVALGFSLGAKSTATLEVFDVTGRLVKTVVDGIHDAGTYEVSWDGTDNSGAAVASGVYFYRLRADGTEFAKKLVVIRNGN